jgi:FixJ family two-component response regulator
MTSPTVHVVDDDAQILRAVVRLLRSYGYRAEAYPSAAQFLSRKLPLEVGCLVLDLMMPEITGMAVQEILSRGDQLLPIVFISGNADIESTVRAMKAGAIDFLTKPFQDFQLISAVRSALTLSEQTLAKRKELTRDLSAFGSLSPREQQVCLGIAQGLLNKQIGFELGTAERTIKVQRAHVMQKLKAQSLPDVVRLVERLRAAGAIPTFLPVEGKAASSEFLR